MAFIWIRGKPAVVGYQPDGDSVRFIPTTVRKPQDGDKVDPSEKDGSIQLRLDAIDAPETHYADQAQPLATPARAPSWPRPGSAACSTTTTAP